MISPVDEILVRWEKDGAISPLRFSWGGRSWQVDSVGRSWRDDTGCHILCTVGGAAVYELILTPALAWQVRPPAGPLAG